MQTEQNLRFINALEFASETNGGALTGVVIDTYDASTGRKYDTVTIAVLATTAATNKAPVLSLKESDDTVATNFAAIVAFTGATATSTSAGFVLPAPEGTQSDSTYKPYCVLNVDTRKRKRYLRLDGTLTTTQTLCAVAILGRPEQAPTTDTTRNVRLQVNG